MSNIDCLPKLPPAIARHTLYLLVEALPEPLSDLPEERAARDEAAIAALAALQPADAFEARLASRAVTTDAHATECLRLATQPGQSSEQAARHRRQAITMMRASEAALRSLRTMQAARAKQDAEKLPAEPAADDVAAEAETFARRHPKDAARIRRAGRVPDGLAPMPPDLVSAIIAGSTPALRALDHQDGDQLPRELAKELPRAA